MPKQKLKRQSEGQLNKDIYDAGEDDRFAEQPDPGRGMTRASQDVMQRRKIIKVSRRKFGSASGATARAPSAPSPAPAASPKAAAPSNPFASTTLAAQPSTTMPTSTSSQASSGAENTPPKKANPFANVAFASSSATSASAPKPSFSFGAPAPAATSAAPKPATTGGFSFAGSNTNNASSSLTTTTTQLNTAMAAPNSSLPLATPSKGKSERIKQLNQNLFHMIVDHWEAKMFTQDYSHFMREYQQHEETLQSEEGEEGSDSIEASGGTSGVASMATSNSGNSQPVSFSFGASAPAPAAKPFAAFGGAAAAPPAGTFSFASTTAAPAAAAPSFSFGGAAPAAGASSAPSFSFGGPSSSSSTSASAPPAASDPDDPTSNPDDGKIDKIEQEENTDEEVLYELRAKHIKFEDGAWKKYGAGILRLYRHNVSGKHRIVIRSAIGKVQFNVMVSKGMKFEKVIKNGKKGKAAYVKFFAMESQERGVENFMLQVKPECVDKLHSTLEGMVA